MITDINQLDLSERYTYADYLTLQFDEVVELIRGKVFGMSPSPSTSHQRLSGNLFRIIANYLVSRPCQVFAALFDVRLPLPPDRQTADQIDTVVQQDLSIICDASKLDERGCQGPPDWIIEILSKGTASKDLTEKYDLYQHAGVREYWVDHLYEGPCSSAAWTKADATNCCDRRLSRKEKRRPPASFRIWSWIWKKCLRIEEEP